MRSGVGEFDIGGVFEAGQKAMASSPESARTWNSWEPVPPSSRYRPPRRELQAKAGENPAVGLVCCVFALQVGKEAEKIAVLHQNRPHLDDAEAGGGFSSRNLV